MKERSPKSRHAVDLDEIQRIRREYERRQREIPADFYALHRPANLFLRQGQERALLHGLQRRGLLPLAGRRILEVGCGDGAWLGIFERFGADREKLAGIELGEERLEAARAAYPGADLRCGDARQLPWADGTFDVVFQSTVLTSILDDGVRRQVAAEMLRVLAPKGTLLWYDFLYDNPRNSQVRGIRAGTIRRLFPGCRLHRSRVTLAPPLARRLVPLSWSLAAGLEALRLFNSHYLATLWRPPSSSSGS